MNAAEPARGGGGCRRDRPIGAAHARARRLLRQPSSRCRISQRRGSATPSPPGRVVAVDDDAPGFTRRLDSPLVDRVEELERLRDVVERAAAERRAVIATVVGAAGASGSRASCTSCSTASPAEAIVLSGRCVAYGGTTYRPLVEILPERRRARGGRTCARGRGQRAAARRAARGRRRPLLGDVHDGRDLLGRPPVRRAERDVSGQFVLVVDDAHWAEPTFHDLVDYLAAFVTQAPVSLIRLGQARAPRPTARHRREPRRSSSGPLVETDARGAARWSRSAGSGREPRSWRSPRETRSSSRQSSPPRSPPTRHPARSPFRRRSRQ